MSSALERLGRAGRRCADPGGSGGTASCPRSWEGPIQPSPLRADRQPAVESGVVSPDGEVAVIRIRYPDDGFFRTPTEQLTTETVALSSEVVNFGEAGPTTGGPTVIGIARSADVAGCLGSTSYDEISDLRTDPLADSPTLRGTGRDLSAAPTDRGF